MDAIITKYHGPTNSQGARIIASRPAAAKYADGPYRLKYAYNHALSAYENHAAAARALWAKTAPDASPGRLAGGQLGDGWAWVWVEEEWMSEDFTCGCGLHVHPSRINSAAIHIHGCPYALGLPSSAAGL